MKVDVLLGLQWGDEGKGKIVDCLSGGYDLIARFQGGPNAGHTLYIDGVKFVLHTIPSGILQEGSMNLIGNGVVIDPITLGKELTMLRDANIDIDGRLLVSHKAHLILPTHRLLDAASEASKGEDKIGSTLRGIGPTYMDKTGRNGLRVGDIFQPQFEQHYNSLRDKHLKLYEIYPEIDFDLDAEEAKWMESLDSIRSLKLVNGEYYINAALDSGKTVLAEGAQGSMLDIEYGTYPFVTSSNTITAGVCTGLGIAPLRIGEVIGITKAYCTRVGSGPFPTELQGETGEQLRKAGHEFGATTGRPRRCGWIDLPQLRYTCMLNGVTQLAITKADVLNEFEELKVATAYEIDGKHTKKLPFDMCQTKCKPVWESHRGWNSELPKTNYSDFPSEAVDFLESISGYLDVPLKFVSTGPQRDEFIRI